MQIIEDEIELWHKWHAQEVSNAEVLKTIEDTVGIVNDGKNKDFIYILDKFVHHYSPTMGKNKWALYNAMTHWSTHTVDSSVPRVTQKNREKLVADAMKSDYWSSIGTGSHHLTDNKEVAYA